jgi:riboflavin kinase / FMN adenylyltransferase
MAVFSWENVKDFPQDPHSFCLGVFDGVHIGHTSLLDKAIRNSKGFSPGVITFDPNPAEVVSAATFPGSIQSIDQRIDKLLERGIVDIIINHFDKSFSQIPGVQFLEMLLAKLPIKHLVVGSNFHCGRNMDTDSEDTAAFLRSRGVRVDIIPPLVDNGIPVSSTRIRNLILDGQVDKVIPLLGNSYILDTSEIGIDRNNDYSSGFFSRKNIHQVIPPIGEYSGDLILENYSLHREAVIKIGESTIEWTCLEKKEIKSDKIFNYIKNNRIKGLLFKRPISVKERSREQNALNKRREAKNHQKTR